MNAREMVRLARKRGFLRTPCLACGQRMVIARSGNLCANCGHFPPAVDAPPSVAHDDDGSER